MKYLLFLIIIFSPIVVYSEERISNFQAELKLNSDRSVSIQEVIQYDFGQDQKRGIFRIIPGEGIGAFTLKDVQRNGEETPFELISKKPLELRIFEEEIFYTGIQTYSITYNMSQATKYFSISDINEINWNVTGTDWSVPIDQVEATIEIPESLQNSEFQIACYKGDFGSGENCQTEREGVSIKVNVNDLAANQGVTLSLGIPATSEYFTNPNWFLKHRHRIDRIGAILVFLIGLITLSYWMKTLQGSKVRQPIIRQYVPPKDLNPAQVGFIKHSFFQGQFISATIIDLARKGYLKIIENKRKFRDTEYIFEQLQYGDDTLSRLEKELLIKLFHKHSKISTTKLAKENFSKHLPIFTQSIYQPLRIFYRIKPSNLWLRSLGVSLLLFVLATLIYILGERHLGWLSTSFLTLSTLVWIIIAFVSPLTPEGAEMKGYILGFEYYLKHAETRRLTHQEQEKVFFELLPHAVALGVVHKWAKAFEKLSLKQPDWYQGNIHTFSAIAFANSISHTSSTFVTSVGGGNTSSSGGGGSVGGGVGGGGGGSI